MNTRFTQILSCCYSNKTMLLKSILALAIVSFLSGTNLSAQSYPMATLTEDGILQLPVGEPIVEKYIFDLSAMEFESTEEMVEFLSTKSGDSYLVRAIPHLGQGILMLNCNSKENWTCTEWNSHLANQCLQLPIAK